MQTRSRKSAGRAREDDVPALPTTRRSARTSRSATADPTPARAPSRGRASGRRTRASEDPEDQEDHAPVIARTRRQSTSRARTRHVAELDLGNQEFADDAVYDSQTYETPAFAVPKEETPRYATPARAHEAEPNTSAYTILELSKLNAHLQQRVSSQQQQLYICTFVALAMLASLLGSVLYPLIEPQAGVSPQTMPEQLIPAIDEQQMLSCGDEGLVDLWLHSHDQQLECCVRSSSGTHECMCIRQGFELIDRFAHSSGRNGVQAEDGSRAGAEYLKQCGRRLRGVHPLTSAYFNAQAYRLLNDPWTAYDTLSAGMRTAERSLGASVQQLYDRLGTDVITLSHQTPKVLLCFRIGLDDLSCENAGPVVLEARYRDARREFDKLLDGADVQYAQKVQATLGDAWIAYSNTLS